MPSLAGAAQGRDLTEASPKNPEKSLQPIREQVGASENLLAVTTATTACMKAFFFFNFSSFSLSLSHSFTQVVSLLNKVCVKRHIQARDGKRLLLGVHLILAIRALRSGKVEHIGKWVFFPSFSAKGGKESTGFQSRIKSKRGFCTWCFIET